MVGRILPLLPLPLLLLAAPRFVSPLAEDGGQTSSFGEYRSDHLHAGADLATGRETGWPVRAIADGKVVRLKAEWRGYGNAVYVEHAGGDVTLYGHLDRLSDRLSPLVAAAAKRKGDRHPGDIPVEPPVPVRAGEVIAWSGESGAGLPHLHFEYRKGGVEPVDPALVGVPLPKDGFPPRPEALRFVPAGLASSADGSPFAVEVAFPAEGSERRAARVVRLSGPQRVALRAHDPAGASRRSLAGWELSVDGRPVAAFRAERASFRSYFLSSLVYDAEDSSAGWQRFTSWLVPPPPSLFGPASGPALLDLPPGPHRLAVRLFDSAGNATTATADVDVAPAATLPRAEAPTGFAELEPRDGGAVLRSGSRFGLLAAPAAGGPVGSVLFSSASRSVEATLGTGRALTVRLPGRKDLAAWPVDPSSIEPAPLPEPATRRPGALLLRSAVVRVGPSWGADLAGTSISGVASSPRESLYRYERAERRWVSASGVKRDGGTVRATTRLAGTFAIFEDTRPPVLENAGRFDDTAGGGAVVEAWDLESGLGRDDVVLVAGDQRLVGEHDPDRGIVVWRKPPAPPFRIEATDRAANRSVLEVTTLPARAKNPPEIVR